MLKNLKSLFIVEEQNAPEKPAEDPKPTVTPSPKIAESREGDPGKITQKFIEVLFKAMESNNLDGFDYLEFKQSLQSLSKMPMDEATRFRSAFAMAETMGATTQQLLSSANHYIDVLKSEETKFEKALANQRATDRPQTGRDPGNGRGHSEKGRRDQTPDDGDRSSSQESGRLKGRNECRRR